MIDLRVMRLPAVWTTNTAALLCGAGMYAIWSFLPGFVQTPSSAGYGFGASVTAAGLLMLPMYGRPEPGGDAMMEHRRFRSSRQPFSVAVACSPRARIFP